MQHIIRDGSDLTSDVLTSILRENGYLLSGNVNRLEIRSSFETPPSRLFYFDIDYSKKNDSELPNKFFLKIPKDHKRHSSGKKEVTFYRDIISSFQSVPTARCFDASYSEKDDYCYCLFEDLSDTYGQTPKEIQKDLSHLKPPIKALANLHALM